MKKLNLAEFRDVQIGKNVVIECENAVIAPGAVIGDGVHIRSRQVYIGHRSVIEKETTVRGLGEEMHKFFVGDNCFIGFRNQILAPEFTMLDYSQLHNSGLSSGYKPLSIGYNCWIGQNTVLNSTEDLEIHNNVRIGTQSQLWTHVASGELLEGCTLYGAKPLVLKDNVWLVGGAVISPGLVLEKNSIIMTGSVLTKSTEPFNTYAGVPAKNVTDKLNFWKELSVDEKYEMAVRFSSEFAEQRIEYRNKILCVEDAGVALKHLENEIVVIVKNAGDMEQYERGKASVFDLVSKHYIKRLSDVEIDWIKFTVGFRARFIPHKQEN